MRLLTGFALFVSLSFLPGLPAFGGAQGLGEVASKEKQKRQAQAKPGRVYTDADLQAASPSATGPASAKPAAPAAGEDRAKISPSSVAASATGAEATPEAVEAAEAVDREQHERHLLEAEWRTRFANVRQQLAVAEAGAWRDDFEVTTYAGLPVRVRKRVHVETEELKLARQLLEELEEEFRRTGLPAGWAREE
jgi:hypothetical protein